MRDLIDCAVASPRPRRGARGRGRQAGRGGAVLDPDRAPAGAAGDHRRAARGALMLRWDWLGRNLGVVLSVPPAAHRASRCAARRAGRRSSPSPVGLIAYRWRRSYPPILVVTEAAVHDPLAGAVPAAHQHGPRLGATVDHRPRDLFARDPRPQPRRGAARRAARGAPTPPRRWATTSRGGCSRSSCRWRCRRSSPACASRPCRPSRSSASARCIGSGGLGQLFIHGFQIDNPIEIWTGIVLTILLALVFDAVDRRRRAAPHPLDAGGFDERD